MTTRYESELQDIEARLRNPAKRSKVVPAEVKHLEMQRERERARTERTRELGNEIKLRWIDGEPEKWETATAEVEIGSVTRTYTVIPSMEIDGKMRIDPKLLRRGYKGVVEDWAVWKWNTDRGAEVDDTDNYILEVQAPAFVWGETIGGKPVAKKPGRKASATHA